MPKTNLVIPPKHRGDSVSASGALPLFISALRNPIKAARYLILDVMWKLTGVYHLASFLGDTPVNIIDVGAAGGINSRWRRLEKNLRILLFEPERDSFNKLVAAFSSDSRVEVFDYALSDHGQTLELYITRWPRSSSVFRPSPEYVEASHIRDHYEITEVVKLRSRRLIDAYNSESGSDLDFIKVDAEGYELPILKGGGSLLESVIGLELEIYFQQVRIGQPLFADVDAFCRQNGFTFMRFTNIGDADNTSHFLLPSPRLESKGFSCTTDAIYFRLPRLIVNLVASGKWSVDKIYKAVALYMVYNQHEYAFCVLTIAAEEHLVAPSDSKFASAMRLIENCSGYNRSLVYHKVCKALSRLSR